MPWPGPSPAAAMPRKMRGSDRPCWTAPRTGTNTSWWWRRSIELAVVPTFGTQWLLPRLKRFQRLHPEVTVNLTNRTRPFLFADTEFDAALYFGDADWSGTVSHFLMRENPVPVCSPELLGGRRTLSAEQVAGLPLMQQSTRPYAWRQWFHSQGLNVAHDMSGPRYELFSMLAQAAMHGMGVALIPPFLIDRTLRRQVRRCRAAKRKGRRRGRGEVKARGL